MKDIIKIILNIFDFFTQQKIIKKIRSELKTQKSISLIDVGSHKGEYISSIKKNFEYTKFLSKKLKLNFYRGPDYYITKIINLYFSIFYKSYH